jgi:DNA-directed RNA polymerase subunit H (RpoH/RPB5)
MKNYKNIIKNYKVEKTQCPEISNHQSDLRSHDKELYRKHNKI